MAMPNSFAEKILKADIVSFDIFDTLIGRTLASPGHVFRLMEPEISSLLGEPVKDFLNIRRSAERDARMRVFEETGREEVSLCQIYEQVFETLDKEADEVLLKMSCQLEMDVERRCLVEREVGRRLFEFAKRHHKPCFLISDMYLPKEFIESILSDIGYSGWDRFYLSCDYGVNKSSGQLFELILEEFKCDPASMVHVGDNLNGDIRKPKSLGINTIHIPRSADTFRGNYYFAKKIFEKTVQKNSTLCSSLCTQLVSDNSYEAMLSLEKGSLNGDPFNFGYNNMGPMILGFVTWLHKQASEQGLDKLLFLSRDGQVLRRAYEAFWGDMGIDSSYIYSSRRIATIASIRTPHDIKRLLHDPIFPRSIASFLFQRFGLRHEDLDFKLLSEFGFKSLEDRVGPKTNKNMLNDLVLGHTEKILRKAKIQRDAYKFYLSQYFDEKQKIGVVDIGYAGSMQKSIAELSDTKVHGFYMATSQGIDNIGMSGHISRGYIVDRDFSKVTPIGINEHRFVYETIICCADDSFLGFDETTGFAAEFDVSGAIHRKSFVKLAHSGVESFCRDVATHIPFDKDDFYLDSATAAAYLDMFLKSPPPEDINVFDQVEFEDSFASDTKRVLVNTTTAENRIMIWNEARRIVEKSHSVRKPKVNKSRKRWLLDYEAILVSRFAGDRKLAKYERDRESFFKESQIPYITAYWRALGQRL
jgi:predicted HAD superfamily hydrolase